MMPMFSCPMITGLLVGGVLYSFTSVPQIPATSIFIQAASSGISGIGYSRISVLLGPTRTAARTFSATETPPIINAGATKDLAWIGQAGFHTSMRRDVRADGQYGIKWF